ncbi:MAG: beta-N-acetylhexosaminidase [Firmicutes bacterium]|jgi:beta-N-acetylhexosaminidase|nr:beta-N-acetylhexosaminidase [Bacillota bacterium]
MKPSKPQRINSLLAVALLFLVVGIAASVTSGLVVGSRQIHPAINPRKEMDILDAMISGLTLEEKIGQMLMTGFEGKALPPESERFLRDYNIGGVVLLGRNISDPFQTACLANSLQEVAASRRVPIGFLISIDQEGGAVVRMTSGVTVFPGNMALGAVGSSDLARAAAAAAAREMLACGINMNLAPVLDVNCNPRNPGIGTRSFSADPRVAAELGAAAVEGCQGEGVIATAKHFPGKGDVTVDSHIELPTVAHPMNRLAEVELAPFRAAIDRGVDVVMTAHVAFPAIEPEPGLPATLSKRVLTGLLRDDLGFKGVVITDDMLMGAIAKGWGVGEAAVRAVQAGADIVLVCHILSEQIAAAEALLSAARAGAIEIERINASVRRILELKRRRGILSPRLVDPSVAASLTGTEEHRALALEIARRAVTLVRNRSGVIPVDPSRAGRVLVVSPAIRALTQVEDDGAGECPLAAAVRQFVPSASSLSVSERPSSDEAAQALALARGADLVIVGTYNAHLFTEQGAVIRELMGLGVPVVAAAMRNPYDISEFPDVDCYITGYGFRNCSMQAVAEAVFGRFEPAGKLPVAL